MVIFRSKTSPPDRAGKINQPLANCALDIIGEKWCSERVEDKPLLERLASGFDYVMPPPLGPHTECRQHQRPACPRDDFAGECRASGSNNLRDRQVARRSRLGGVAWVAAAVRARCLPLPFAVFGCSGRVFTTAVFEQYILM